MPLSTWHFGLRSAFSPTASVTQATTSGETDWGRVADWEVVVPWHACSLTLQAQPACRLCIPRRSNLAEDVRVLASLARSMLHEAGMVGVELPSGVVEEVARWGSGDLVSVATALGAMACQEAIKILTRQFVPVQGTVLLNAVHASTSVFAL